MFSYACNISILDSIQIVQKLLSLNKHIRTIKAFTITKFVSVTWITYATPKSLPSIWKLTNHFFTINVPTYYPFLKILLRWHQPLNLI